MKARRVEEVIQLIHDLCDSICDEPMATGEPMESVQLGRLQVIDEIRAILPDHEDHAGGKFHDWFCNEKEGYGYYCRKCSIMMNPKNENGECKGPVACEPHEMVECPDCQGNGFALSKHHCEPFGLKKKVECKRCNGTGKVDQ